MTRKKSIFEKWGLVESSEAEFDQSEIIQSLQLQSQEIDEQISTSQATQTFFEFEEDEDFLTVEEAYEKAGVSDLSKSIFKADEFSNHLPDMPSEVKRQSVIGLLGASGLEVDQLVEDANERIGILQEVKSMTNEMSVSIIEKKEQEITNLLSNIDSLKQDILDRKTSQEKQDELINEELEKINKVLKFISSK